MVQQGNRTTAGLIKDRYPQNLE